MVSKVKLLKRATAFMLASVLAFTTVFSTNISTVNAAGSKVVTKIKVAKKTLTLEKGKSKNVKVTVSAKKGASKKFTVKSSKKSVATAKVSGKNVKITAKKAGTATITVTTKGKNMFRKE